jgi:hypothetical protein
MSVSAAMCGGYQGWPQWNPLPMVGNTNVRATFSCSDSPVRQSGKEAI